MVTTLPILPGLWQRRGRLQWHTVPSEPSFHLVAYPVQVSIDAVGQCQPFIPVQQVVAVILFLGSGCPATDGNPGIVHDIDEVADQLLGFRYKIAELVQTEQLVLKI